MAVPPAAMQLVVALTAVTLQEAALPMTILTLLRLLETKKFGVRKIDAGSGTMHLMIGSTFAMPTAILPTALGVWPINAGSGAMQLMTGITFAMITAVLKPTEQLTPKL